MRGLVRLATGAPAADTSLVVRVWHSDRGQERLLGESPLDGDGAFDVRYVLSAPATEALAYPSARRGREWDG